MDNNDGLTTAVLYNPRQLSRETLKAIFTARLPLFERLLQDLHAVQPMHQLIVGARGMGKTSLLRRIGIAIEDDASLRKRLLPLTFPEEQYNVGSLGEFYLNCLDALADYLDKHEESLSARKVDAIVQQLRNRPEAEVVEASEAALVSQASSMKRQFVLLVDNFSIIIDRLSDTEKWRLREWLSRSERRPILIGGTVKFISDTANYGQAFYEFLNVHELPPCRAEEAIAILRELARVFHAPQVEQWLEADPSRLTVLNRLAGGAPRTLVMLFQLLAQGIEGQIFQELDRLLDLATPLYKARFEELPDQAQRVVDALALHWDPATRQDLEGVSRIGGNAISSQLSRLAKMGVVEEVHIPGETKTAYQIAERFFNIWYLMRASRRSRHQLRWLVEFLKAFYSAGDRTKLAQTLLHSAACEPVSQGRRLLAMSQAVEDQHLQRELRNTALFSFAKADRKHRADMDLSDIDKDWLRKLDELGATAKEVDFILEGIDREPKDVSALRYRELGLLYESQAQLYLKAEEAYRKAIELDPKNAWAWNRLGYFLTDRRGRHAEAEAAFRKAIELDPKNAWPWDDLGSLLTDRLGRHEEAEAAFRKAIEFDPKNAWPWHHLGNLLTDRLGRHEEAEAAFRKATELDPKNALAWDFLGKLLTDRLGRHEEAVGVFRQAIELNPTNGWLLDDLGQVLADHLGRHAEAENAFRKAIELNPKHPWLWLRLGNLLAREAGRSAEAEQAFRKAVELDSRKSILKQRLAWFLFEQDVDSDEVESLARQACDLDPSVSRCHSLACILARRGKVIESLQWIRKAIASLEDELRPRDLDFLTYYFRELVHQGQAELGLRLLEELERTETWRPLAEALRAAAHRDRDSLKRINPEQREAAEGIYDFLTGDVRRNQEHPK